MLRTGCEDAGTFGPGCGVMAIDTLVHSTDVPPGMSMREAGAKAVTACVSDMAAKGSRPLHAAVSVSLPAGSPKRDASGTAAGIRDACRRYGIRVVTGDTNEGAASITVCLLGRSKRVVPRGGARPGDAVFVSGPFGMAAAGLDSAVSGGSEFSRHVRRPAARLEFGVRCSRHMSASMDSSDGLAATLHEIARESGVRIDVDAAPVGRGVARYAEARGIDALELVFYGGEEYEVVFCAPPSKRRAIFRVAARTGAPVIEVGRVAAGRGVYHCGKRMEDAGWGRPRHENTDV